MVEFGSFYKSTKKRKYNTWCKYTNMLDTYGCGCQHDCKYCYSKCLLDFRGNWNTIEPRIAFISEIIKTVQMVSKSTALRMGCMTDCFQPIEKVRRVTYQTIKVLNNFGINYLIVTKSDLVADDEYVEIYDKDLAHFQITITTTDDNKCLEYEKAPVVSKRIAAIEKLYSLGFDVSVRLSPFMYQWVDFDKLNSIGCDKILVEFLKVNHWIRKWFDIDYSLHTVKYGGYDNLELDHKIELMENIKGFKQISVGEYVKSHYEYFRENVNHNKEDCCNLDIRKVCPEPSQVALEL